MPSIHPPAYPYTCKTCHLCHTQTLHSLTVFVPTHYSAVCMLKQIIQERNRSQTQQPLLTPCLGTDKGRLWDLWPQDALSHSGQGEHWRVSLSSHELFHVHAWVPLVSSVETESRGFDWQSLWSHNSHALYDQRLSDGGKTRALLTLSPIELCCFYSFHLLSL